MLWAVSATAPAHPNLLMRPAVAANTAVMYAASVPCSKFLAAACRQGGLQLGRPLVVGPGEAKHLVRGQVQVTEHRSERLARIDRVQELLPHLEW